MTDVPNGGNQEMMIVPIGTESIVVARQRAGQLWVAMQKMRESFVEGIHYMTIPGGGQPSLLLPGAERVCTLMGLVPEVNELVAIRTPLNEAYFEYEVTLIHEGSGTRVSYGRGAYGVEDLRSNEKPNRNKMIKMALKRAYVDAAKRAGMLSGDFTQDMEDAPQMQPRNGAPARSEPREPNGVTVSAPPDDPGRDDAGADAYFEAQEAASSPNAHSLNVAEETLDKVEASKKRRKAKASMDEVPK